MKYRLFRGVSWICLALTVGLLSACSSVSLNRAPVEDRANTSPAPSPSPVVGSGGVKQAPGFDNAGKSGYYTVKPGDTLLKIALENGQSHHDLANWNQLENPNRIEVGQVLRVIPPVGGEVVVKPVPKATAAANPVSAPAPAPAPVAPVASTTVPPAPVSAPVTDSGTSSWIWPANGPVLAGFDEAKNNKGIDIGGKIGDPIFAVAEARVIYVGAGIRGYGNLIILKHLNGFLTAYAHNKIVLIKEDQSVLKGQKIAEMGNSDTDRVKLHFEIRRDTKVLDPLKYLPAR